VFFFSRRARFFLPLRDEEKNKIARRRKTKPRPLRRFILSIVSPNHSRSPSLPPKTSKKHPQTKQIVVARAYNSEQMTDLLISLAAKMVEEPFRLLIVDSVMALYRTDYTGRGELAERQQKLGQFLAALKRLSETYGVAVVLTNQVMSTPEGGMTCEFFVLVSLLHACFVVLHVFRGVAARMPLVFFKRRATAARPTPLFFSFPALFSRPPSQTPK
jgi:hypothetical protein